MQFSKRRATLPGRPGVEPMWRHVRDAVIGTIIIAAIYYALATLPLPVMAMAYILPVIVGGFNGILFIAAGLMLVVAAWRRRPGLALAPVLFVALWFSAAVVQRVVIAAREDPKLAERPVPADLRSIRTLIIESQVTQMCCGLFTLLADGLIDRYVHVFLDHDHKLSRIEAYDLGRGDECKDEDRGLSVLLARAGRTDECIRRKTIDAIPDGVVVRMHAFARAYAAMGCCNRGTISIRSGETETLRATWYYGKRAVLSYLPLFGDHGWGQTVPLWSSGSGGPAQLVDIGGPPFHHEELAAAVYGIDWRAPVKPAVASAPELVQRAMALVQLPKWGDRLPALDIALTLQEQRLVNDDLLDVVAALVHGAGQGLDTTMSIMRFWGHLNDNDKRSFIERVFARMENPAQGYDFNECVLSFHLPPEKFPGVAERAENIFVNRRDLKPWQYELALRLAQKPYRGMTPPPETRQRMFMALQDDESEAFARRAIAFKRVYLFAPDEEREFFSRRLDLVPDQLLKEYLDGTGWHRSSNEKALSQATRDYRQRALVRIAAIRDDQLRRDAQEKYRLERND
jgi:hypothetical protein